MKFILAVGWIDIDVGGYDGLELERCSKSSSFLLLRS